LVLVDQGDNTVFSITNSQLASVVIEYDGVNVARKIPRGGLVFLAIPMEK
jgi:hypothetical protein